MLSKSWSYFAMEALDHKGGVEKVGEERGRAFCNLVHGGITAVCKVRGVDFATVI
jgi:hypothetical protein